MTRTELKKTSEKTTPHDSAMKHVAGDATYIDDMALPANTLHAYLGLSTNAHAKIISRDYAKIKSIDGVVGVIDARDIPHTNDISPTGIADEPVFAEETCSFYGQPLFAVIATSRKVAREAAQFASIEYEPLDAVLNYEKATENVTAPMVLKRRNVGEAMGKSSNKIEGSMLIGGQDHFYLEGQIALALPGEDDDVIVYSSTQHPSEVQHMVAHVLAVANNCVEVIVRRTGGGFGGKETQANLFAVVCAIAAKKYKLPVKLRPDRDDDMIATGKRHDFKVDYQVGFDSEGRIEAVNSVYAARCGFSADLSGPVTDRALFHADNCYYYPDVQLSSNPLKTNMVSATAFRGFGGPQGMLGGERLIEEIAYYLNVDPLEIRKKNFYSNHENGDGRCVTPYHQTVEDNIVHRLVDELEESSSYQKRRAAILKHNQNNSIIKKGISLIPIKFGISFTATWFNQAGALIHVYQDGSIHLNHGGIEMGQGLNTKVAQVVADAFGVSLSTVKITPTTTAKVPNTSATAASSGTDLNAMAALNAVEQIKGRLIKFACEHYNVLDVDVCFADDSVRVGKQTFAFSEFVKSAYMERVQLSAAGFYKTPKITWNRQEGKGRPFYYYSYAASVSEVSIDTLTGEYRVERVDILHDVGNSLNPDLDRGQIEGGFIQGMGWLTTEELWWDSKGQLKTHAPSTYKIPLASDIPPVFNVNLAHWSKNKERTIKRSKAVGEPPFMLAMSVLEAISMAVASVANYKISPRLDTPATPERVLMAVQKMRDEADKK